MEIVLSVLLVLSLFGNYHQHENTKELKAEIIMLEQTNENNLNALTSVTEVNENNAKITDNLRTDLNQCSKVVEEFKQTIEDYKDEQAAIDLAAEELESKLADSELSNCRVPVWLADEISTNY